MPWYNTVEVFNTIIYGTMMKEKSTTFRLFFVMLERADSKGEVKCAKEFLRVVCNQTEEELEAALKALMSPDPDSTSKECDGRRVQEVGPNHWKLVNYEKYRDALAAEKKRAADRKRAYEKYHADKPATKAAPKPEAVQPKPAPAPERMPDVPRGTGEEGGKSLKDILDAKFNPAAQATHREPPPGACPKKKPEADMTRLPVPGERELALLAAALLNGGCLDASAQDAVDWIMQNDEPLGNRLREKGMDALSEVGARSGKPMYAVIAQRYIDAKTGTRRDDE